MPELVCGIREKQDVCFVFFQALGLPQEAIVCYQRAVQTRPNYAIAFGESCCTVQ